MSSSSPSSSISSTSVSPIDGCCFVCVECPSSFQSLLLLETHLDSQHRQQRRPPPLSLHSNNNNQSTSDEQMAMKLTVKSEELDAEMEDDEGIDHRSTITNTPSPNGSEHSGSMLEDARTPNHLMNKNECRFCHQIFDNQIQLSVHYTRDHSERKHYSCSECEAVFAVKRELATHFRIHQGATPHTCDECGKEFGTRQLLKKHCMWHSGERSHVCPHCNKAFFQKGHLTQHLMIHAGGRPHVCTLCNKTFIFKFDLNRHMKIHAERGFACQHCGKAFARHKQLQEHILVKCKANPNSAPSTPLGGQMHSERRSSMSNLTALSNPSHPTPSSLLQSVPVSLSSLPQLATPRAIPFHSNQSLPFGTFSVEELNRFAQSILTQQQRSILPDPVPQNPCLVCGQSFPSQPALLLHMAMHINVNTPLFQNAHNLMTKSELKPDTLRTPLSVMASLPNAVMEHDEAGTPSITDSATSSSCPNSPQKTSPAQPIQSRSPSPTTTAPRMIVNENHLGNKCCEECIRQRARTEELEGEVQRQRETIRNTRHLLDQVSLLASQLGGCSPFDPTFALQSKHVFQQIQTALRNVECQ